MAKGINITEFRKAGWRSDFECVSLVSAQNAAQFPITDYRSQESKKRRYSRTPCAKNPATSRSSSTDGGVFLAI